MTKLVDKMTEHYFYAKYQNGKVETRGLDRKFLGHQIKHTPGKKPDGIFVDWTWDGSTFTVQNDRYGFYPLYYYCAGNEICISTSIERLMAEGAPGELDYQALSVFLRIGFFIGDDTPFKHIRALPPDAKFRWRNGKLDVSGRYCRASERLNLSYDEMVDRYVELFRQSVKRRLPKDDNFAVPISGGRDSRHILFELLAAGRKPKFCLTIQRYPPGVNDIPVARLVAKRLNLKHITLQPSRCFFKNEMQRNRETSFCSDELRESAAVTDYLLDKVSVYYDGIAGGALTTAIFCRPAIVGLYEEKRFSDAARKIMNVFERYCMPEVVFNKLFQDRFHKEIGIERAVDHLTREIKKHEGAVNPSTQFIFWNRTRREIALSPYAISSVIPTIYSPYLDHDLYDFLSSLNARDCIVGHDFHTETIARAFPQYADIPYTEKATAPSARRLQMRYAFDLMMYLTRERKTAQELMRLQYVLPGLTRYCLKGDNWWVAPHMMHYLVELKKYINKSR